MNKSQTFNKKVEDTVSAFQITGNDHRVNVMVRTQRGGLYDLLMCAIEQNGGLCEVVKT